MISNQIPFFGLIRTDPVSADGSNSRPHGPKYGFETVLSQKCRTYPMSNKYQILKSKMGNEKVLEGVEDYDRKIIEKKRLIMIESF